jgi:hypothetical protein
MAQVNSFIGNVLAPAHSGMTVYDVGDYQVRMSLRMRIERPCGYRVAARLAGAMAT